MYNFNSYHVICYHRVLSIALTYWIDAIKCPIDIWYETYGVVLQAKNSTFQNEFHNPTDTKMIIATDITHGRFQTIASTLIGLPGSPLSEPTRHSLVALNVGSWYCLWCSCHTLTIHCIRLYDHHKDGISYWENVFVDYAHFIQDLMMGCITYIKSTLWCFCFDIKIHYENKARCCLWSKIFVGCMKKL